MNEEERLRETLEEIVIKHCPSVKRNPAVSKVHASAILLNFTQHEKTIGRFSQSERERLCELNSHLSGAVNKMASLSEEAAQLIGGYVEHQETWTGEVSESLEAEEVGAKVRIKVEHFSTSDNGSPVLENVSERHEARVIQHNEDQHSARENFEAALEVLREMNKAVRRARRHYRVKQPNVGNINSEQVAVAAACNRIWLREQGQRPGRDFQSGGPGPFGRFLTAVFEALGFELEQARSAQRRFIDLGGVEAMGISIEPLD